MTQIKPKQKYIYKITNLLNKKAYIGQTIHPDRRWTEHKQNAKNGLSNLPIHLAMAKYGIENFSFEILELTSDYDKREKDLIKFYNSLSPNGYNIAEGGSNFISTGEDHPRNTISDSDVLLIVKELQKNILSDREIADIYNTTDKIISDINHGRTHVISTLNYPIRIKKGKQKLKENEILEIKDLLKNSSMSYSKIADLYGVSKGTIYHINKGLTFKNNNQLYPIRKRD